MSTFEYGRPESVTAASPALAATALVAFLAGFDGPTILDGNDAIRAHLAENRKARRKAQAEARKRNRGRR